MDTLQDCCKVRPGAGMRSHWIFNVWNVLHPTQKCHSAFFNSVCQEISKMTNLTNVWHLLATPVTISLRVLRKAGIAIP
ncbi:hypothetical protein [Cupriavidus necator]|uniref:hypothetical protein n=1 Tax=Cupriavidus necator TaxID=106590 RepID=UPI00115F78A1|nr:hypothetical protein [Cupriavidus necator]